MVAYPLGLESSGGCIGLGGLTPLGFNAGLCCGNVKVDDVAFMESIASYMKDTMCASNVFVSGFSNGAMMANRLACESASTFSGFAAVEGTLVADWGPLGCKPSKPVSLLSFCGTSDYMCNLEFGANNEMWREKSGCSIFSKYETYSTATTTCHRYNKCHDSAMVEYCVIEKLGHCW